MRRAPAWSVAPLLAAGCAFSRQQNALVPGGPQSARIAGLLQLAFWIALVVYLLTMAAVLVAAFHRRRRVALPNVETPPETERRNLRWVGAAVGATILVLFGYLVADLVTNRALHALELPRPLTVRVVGHQWWWEVEYLDSLPSRRLTTANEIHIPVGRPVLIQTEASDVIHSFWVPNLHGKRDNVPGMKNRLYLQADRPGIYRGECAEFCGTQHAKMAFVVVAEPEREFAGWYQQQLAEAVGPGDTLALRGRQVFLEKPCAMCHAIRGTPAGGHVGPDLTHLASRRTLAAGTLPNTRGHLAGWILDPQSLKPGTLMPSNEMHPDELKALLAYLETLR